MAGSRLGKQSGACNVICISPFMAPAILARVRHFLIAGQHASGQVYDEVATIRDLRNKRLLLWVADGPDGLQAAMLTRLMHGADGLMCCLIVLGGEGLFDWLHFLDRIEAYAKREGCVKVRLEGRLGWKRLLAEYVQTGVILEKRID